MRWLVEQIHLGASQVMDKLIGSNRVSDIKLLELWANVNTRGSWNAPHAHPVPWSGILYVRASPDTAGSPANPAETIFFNPVSEARLFGQDAVVRYPPEEGSMLFFPGYLLHMVVPHLGDEPRITLAFNISYTQHSTRIGKSP